MKFTRSHMCGDLRKKDISKEVCLMGWVNKIRNLGPIIFIDLRDITGICQIIIDSDNKEIFDKAKNISNEYVLEIKGIVRERESKNSNIDTGDIEVYCSELNILNKSKTPPIYIKDDDNVSENLKLKYRYLDLRKPSNQKNLILRANIFREIRNFMYENYFIEVETPFLTKPTPEGARDYLVPSRVNEGKFFALPQSPQLMKQLLMVSGMNRYYQIVKCFRDEDLRANRQPEFTQLDLEMSFAKKEDVIEMNERLIKVLFDKFTDYNVKLPLKKITYKEAMEKYGSDKPDLRYEYTIENITDIFIDTEFPLFKENLVEDHSIRAINFTNLSKKYSRKDIKKLEDFAKDYGLKNLHFIKFEDEISSSMKKFLTDDNISKLKKQLKVENGDLVFIVSDSNEIVLNSLGAIRRKVANDNCLYDKKDYSLLWIIDFPMFEYSKEEDRYVSQHHPFTKPNDSDIQFLKSDPKKVMTEAYDIVINGDEIGGGSVRIHDSSIQKKVFEALNLSDEEIENKFGFFIEALNYGTPPHAGIAWGLDRLVMIFANTNNIKDVIAFPKTQSATCPLTNAPSIVNEASLKELRIEVRK